MNVDPLAVYFVTSGAAGNALLFKYPHENEKEECFEVLEETENIDYENCELPVSLFDDFRIERYKQFLILKDCLKQVNDPNRLKSASNLRQGRTVDIEDITIEHLLAVNNLLCNNKFELKISDVIFVGFPILALPEHSTRKDSTSLMSFHIAFALNGNSSSHIIELYQELSRRLAVSLRFEQERCNYLSDQKNLIWAIRDEIDNVPEDQRECPFRLILQDDKCTIALLLREVYLGLCNTGIVEVRVNNLVRVSFCIPEKVHNPSQQNFVISFSQIERHINSIRPYHSFIITEKKEDLLQKLQPEANPNLVRIIKVANVTKSLPELANLADLPIQHVFDSVAHLVYWGKALVIYPLCEHNVYCVSPSADCRPNSTLADSFFDECKRKLPDVLSQFSLPTRVGDLFSVFNKRQQKMQITEIIKWLLRHKQIIQHHTYVYLEKYDEKPKTNPISIEVNDSINEELNKYPDIKDILQSCPAAQNEEDLKLFLSIVPHLNGEHHIEDIMYRENMKRSTILTILDKFRDVVCVNEREDAGISYWIS
ncbi:DgyrCDS10342 [Dimorphilus gyrociliatus]|uniref:GATOR complex protein NPRL3 n=1 Tax=Dimorphilus gyrociliatus TaxID=2664684 RepID=A0A7I8VZY2_9ANNE|nr:DgyrCDS10342 [Dimorphilus gyrociliatus]